MKIGFLVPHLGTTQIAFSLIHNTNEFCKNNLDTDITLFYENQVKPCKPPRFVTTNVADAWSYTGNLITTNLTTTHKSLRFPGPCRKYFYVIDLEWIRIPNKIYEKLAEVYQNPGINLLARSKEHADRIEEAWCRPVRGVVKNFNIQEFINIINEDENAAGTNKKLL